MLLLILKDHSHQSMVKPVGLIVVKYSQQISIILSVPIY